mgnify:CR=1 FL=1
MSFGDNDSFFQLDGFDFDHGPDEGGSEAALEEDGIVVPDIKPRRSEGSKPVILMIDDDYSTLDLVKIYLQRNYDFVCYSGPKEAIFYLNNNIPDMILLDCYIHSIKARRVVEIIRSYSELKDVPIIYVAEKDEIGAVMSKLPETVTDVLSRPIARGELQVILDKYIKA